MALAFRDEEFLEACEELLESKVEGWEFFVESRGITVYRLYNETSGLYQYKIYGVLDDVLPEICAQVYLDFEYRKQWDTYVKEVYQTEVNGRKLTYWNANFPFPLWNRDYVFQRELKVIQHQGRKAWVVLSRSHPTPTIPPRSGIVRVDEYFQSVAMTLDGKVGTRAFFHIYDNPKGNIPAWLVNWITKTGIPQYIDVMHKACKRYPEYLASKNRTG